MDRCDGMEANGRGERGRALDKREYLMIISKPYIVTPHLNHLVEMVQMKGYNIWYYAELTEIIPNYHQILALF